MAVRSCVVGAGSWGTALAAQLAREGVPTAIWDRHPERCDAIDRDHRNPRYLRDVDLPHALRGASDLAQAVSSAELLVTGVPSHALRDVMVQARPHLRDDAVICCATKGVEEGSLQTMAEVLVDVLGEAARERVVVLSGPSFARELAEGKPTTVVVAGADAATRRVAEAFHGGALRVYHTHDLVGACIGGSLKNVLAIACGMSDGLGLGLNARAGLITRGLAEITRLAVALGAEPLTMMGLAGLGDLVLTCTGNLSRNRRVGLALGEGRTLDDILEELGEVAEGVVTARSAWALAQRTGVEMPISEQVHAVLHEGRSAQDALGLLMGRQRKHERG